VSVDFKVAEQVTVIRVINIQLNTYRTHGKWLIQSKLSACVRGNTYVYNTRSISVLMCILVHVYLLYLWVAVDSI